ncbi:MAG: prepilin peptidase [Patescibacteria group bacterium]|nr:prepilin peptidase [bacterium]MDZ4226911.1 prepilin peptidase [Patescibacteria group bacterium]
MLLALPFGILGLIMGSFINVLVLRRGAKSIRGRSECMSCGALIRWYDNIPVISWFFLRGRCRACGSSISAQYPLVELVTGALFALVAGAAYIPPGPDAFAAVAVLLVPFAMTALLVAIAVYDLKHTVIPDGWVYTFGALALLSALLNPYGFTIAYVLLAGPLTALPLFVLWLISKGRWMGLGDAKLALGIGWLLGPLYGVVALFLAFIIGALVSLPLLLLSSGRGRGFLQVFTHTEASSKLVRGVTMKSEIPFGPFLVAACIIVWLSILYGVDLLEVLGIILPGSL